MSTAKDILSTAIGLLFSSGQWPLALALVVVGAAVIVILAKYGGSIRAWLPGGPMAPERHMDDTGGHVEGTGLPPMVVGPDGSIPLAQSGPKDPTEP